MILYFSGTGNSRHAALQLAAALNDTARSIHTDLLQGCTLEDARPLIVCAPIYAWRMANVMADYLRRCTFAGSGDVYFVLTCGSSMGNAPAYCRDLCSELSLRCRGVAKLVMPENYVAMFPVPDAPTAVRIVRAADRRLAQLADYIRADRDFPKAKVSLGGRFLSKCVNTGFYKYYVGDKKFRTTDGCIGCGKCAQVCPLGNIRLTDSRPVWQGNCTHCMACICHCPTTAIEHGKASVGKRRYTCPDTAETK